VLKIVKNLYVDGRGSAANPAGGADSPPLHVADGQRVATAAFMASVTVDYHVVIEGNTPSPLGTPLAMTTTSTMTEQNRT